MTIDRLTLKRTKRGGARLQVSAKRLDFNSFAAAVQKGEGLVPAVIARRFRPDLHAVDAEAYEDLRPVAEALGVPIPRKSPVHWDIFGALLDGPPPPSKVTIKAE